MKKHYILAGFLALAATPGFAQVKIGAAGTPDASATLEVTGGAANNKGLLLPRLTTAQRNAIANPAKGLLIFNTTTNEVQTNIGTPATPVWSTTPVAGWNITGNADTNPATNFIGTTDNQPLSIRTNNAEAARVQANGRVGIGVAAPEAKLHLNDGGLRITNGATSLPDHAIHVINDGGGAGANDNIVITSYGTNLQPSIGTEVARGTVSAPANIEAGDNLGNFYFNARINNAQTWLSRIGSTYLGNGTTNKSNMTFHTSGAIAATIDSSGNLGVGTASPKTRLQLNGGILLNRDKNIAHGNGSYIVWSSVLSGSGETEFINYQGTGAGGFRFYNVDPQGSAGTANFPDNDIAFIAPDGSYNNVSDKRVKTNVNIIENGLAKVMAMRPVSYDFHMGRTLRNGVVKFTEHDKTVNRIGFLAQELEKVVPEAVLVPKDPANELYNVSYTTLIPVLTKAIQEQQAEIEKLKAQLVAVKSDNATLKAEASQVAALAERMQRLEASIGTKAADRTAAAR